MFLVGASSPTAHSIRDRIRDALSDTRVRGWGRTQVYYPEHLFEEILRAPGAEDLLSLENDLAGWVHAIVVIAESPGAICELGAFANHDKLKDKLVVLIDKKYRRKRSFIMLGPVRFLAKRTRSEVLYADLSLPDIKALVKRTRQSLRRIAKEAQLDRSPSNPIVAELFLLTLSYVCEPLRESDMTSAIARVMDGPLANAKLLTKIIIKTLITSRDITRGERGYMLTSDGVARLQAAIWSTGQTWQIQHTLDKLRVTQLNRTLRKPMSAPV